MYIPALFKGSRCTEEELDALAEKYSGYTGLKKEYVLGSNLRVTLDDFMTELLKDKKLMIGRYEAELPVRQVLLLLKAGICPRKR